METIYNKQHSLSELIAPDQFMSYEDLKTKLNRALGLGGVEVSTATAETIADDNTSAASATATEAPWADTPVPATNSEDSGSDTMSYVEKLANDS
jgi:hypothetical protein